MVQNTLALGKIHSYPNNPNVQKALIAAKYNNATFELSKDFEMGVTNKSAEFLLKFPLGKVPVLETPTGPIFESGAIAYYAANCVKDTTLLGKSNYEAASIQQFVLFAQTELTSNLAAWWYPILGYAPYNRVVENAAKEKLVRALKALNQILLPKTFLVGERVTLADITVATALSSAYQNLFDEKFRADFPNVTRWFLTCVNQPHFKSVLGEIQLCTTMATYDPKKNQPVKEEKKKEQKPKEAPKPKEKKKEEKEPEDDDGIPRDEEPKRKNPLDALPPSSFNLDAWKRFYSNNEEKDSVKYFWENFEAQGWSMWKVDYKYNNELTQVFMSSNLIGGFFQRLDRARKYAFGSMIVCGENNNNTISGYFIMRGQEVIFEITDSVDYESYSFKKVDPAKAKDAWNDYISWSGKSLPGKFADGKIFK